MIGTTVYHVCMLQIEYDDVVPVLPAKSMTHNKSFLDRLQRVEKHLRKNKLKLTLTQRLGNAQDEDDVRHRAPISILTSFCVKLVRFLQV